MQSLEFPSVFAAAPNPYLLLAAESPYTILAANDAYLAATLTTREQLVGRAIFDAFPDNPADPAATGVRNLRASLEHVVARREAHAMAVQRYDIRRRDGAFEERYWSPTNSPVLGADGRVAYVIHWVQDVTELVHPKVLEGERAQQAEEPQGRFDRREAAITLREEDLAERLLAHRERGRLSAERRREAEERERLAREVENERARLRTVIEEAPAFICVLRGPGHTHDLANPPYLALIGKRDVVGKTVADVLPEVGAQGYLDLLDRVYHTGEPFRGNEMLVRLRRTEGGELEERVVDFVFQPLREPDGTITGVFVHGVDLTETVRSREVARASERRLRTIFESDMVGTFYWDMDGGVSAANDRFLRMVGYTREDMTGGDVRWASMTPPEHRHLDERSVAEFKATGVCTPYEKFLTYVHPDDRAEEDRKFRAAVASGQNWRIDCRVAWPDGSVHWALKNSTRPSASVIQRICGVASAMSRNRCSLSRRAASARTRAVVSTTVLSTPTTAPPSSRTGENAKE